MQYSGNISTEGGPIIVSDANIIGTWDGIENDDYKQLCTIFDSQPHVEGFSTTFKNCAFIAWELEGGGTVDIYTDKNKILLIKSWLPTSTINNKNILLIPISEKHTFIGDLIINNNFIFIFWATESCYNVKYTHTQNSGRLTGNFAMENSSFYLKTNFNKFRCLHDKITENGIIARRLHLIPY